MEGRSNTSLREIIRKYDMTPVACNFYEAEFVLCDSPPFPSLSSAWEHFG